MYLSSYKPRVRIEGVMIAPARWKLHIFDAETGEEIENIMKAEIILLPAECPTVSLTYLEQHEGPRPFVTEETMRVEVVEVLLTAQERRA